MAKHRFSATVRGTKPEPNQRGVVQSDRGVRVNPKETLQQTKTPNRTRCVLVVGCGVNTNPMVGLAVGL